MSEPLRYGRRKTDAEVRTGMPVINGRTGDATVRIAAGLTALILVGIFLLLGLQREIPTEIWVTESSLITFLVGTRVVTSDTAKQVKDNGSKTVG